MDDKRKFRRFQINLPGSLVLESDLTRSVPVTVVDTSFGGLGLVADESLAQGESIRMIWERPPFAPGDKIEVKCRIVSSRRKPSQPGKFAVSAAYLENDPALIEKILRWAQLQSHVQAKANLRAASNSRLRRSSFY
jgi:hypothetical protein